MFPSPNRTRLPWYWLTTGEGPLSGGHREDAQTVFGIALEAIRAPDGAELEATHDVHPT